MKKKVSISILVFVGLLLVVGSLYGTFAYNSIITSNNDSYTVTLSGNSEKVTVPASGSKTVVYKVTNTNKGVVQYGLAYQGSNINAYYYEDTEDMPSGLIDYGQNKFIKLYIENTSPSSNTVTIKPILGYEHGGNLIVPSGYTLVTEKYTPIFGLAKYITDLYNNAGKEVVINNGIKYNYAPSINLMNDRLGGTTSNYDDGNIRYYGAAPNNYIYFNCDNYNEQSTDTCELWRIIGVFDGMIKIIKSDDIGYVIWNTASSSDWSSATLQKHLNEDYYNEVLNNSTRNKIASVTWNLGGWGNTEIYSNQSYAYERGNNKCSDCGYDSTWKGNIALMYPSDYGYAVDFNKCSENLYKYNSNSCSENDWLYHSSVNEWLMTPGTLDDQDVWIINYGRIYTVFYDYNLEETDFVARPTLYLNSDEDIKDGNGTIEKPYQLSVAEGYEPDIKTVNLNVKLDGSSIYNKPVTLSSNNSFTGKVGTPPLGVPKLDSEASFSLSAGKEVSNAQCNSGASIVTYSITSTSVIPSDAPTSYNFFVDNITADTECNITSIAISPVNLKLYVDNALKVNENFTRKSYSTTFPLETPYYIEDSSCTAGAKITVNCLPKLGADNQQTCSVNISNITSDTICYVSTSAAKLTSADQESVAN